MGLDWNGPPQVPPNLEAEDPEAWQKEEQERIDSAMPLTEEEVTEKERLLQEVFPPFPSSSFPPPLLSETLTLLGIL